jgi:16S rRNA (guanine527-N7)-methyltransferase
MNPELRALLSNVKLKALVSTENIDLLERFYDLTLAESKIQNLTTLLKPEEFFEGHFVDVFELLESHFPLNAPLVDLGSGGGVPGIPYTILSGEPVILIESEIRKTEFLVRAVEALGLAGRIQVVRGRAEEVLPSLKPVTVMARAVGPVDRLLRFLKNCSTWNDLILFKGPKWEEEWEKSLLSIRKERLPKVKIHTEYQYTLGLTEKSRKIIHLKRST